MPQFDKVTLLITHYNRSASLGRLLAAFRNLPCVFGDIVVSDDGSRPEHLEALGRLREEFSFRLVKSTQNRGLGNNINKGQDAVRTAYTLYVQEDFEPSVIFPAHFADALEFMENDPSLDMARFYAYFRYPKLKPYGKGYSEMIFSYADPDHLKFYLYSDHPHLRRSDFFEKFGRYPEGKKGDRTEFAMALSFLHHKARGIFFEQYHTLFFQKNTAAEPSTMNRAGWRESRSLPVRVLRWFYLRSRWVKNSFELLFFKTGPKTRI